MNEVNREAAMQNLSDFVLERWETNVWLSDVPGFHDGSNNCRWAILNIAKRLRKKVAS